MAFHQSFSSENRTSSAPSSGTQTPVHTSHSPSMSSSMISSMWTGLVRHFTIDGSGDMSPSRQPPPSRSRGGSGGPPHLAHSSTEPTHQKAKDGINDVFVPSHLRRTASPFRPPPLDPILLHGYKESTSPSARLLTTNVAEEIRIMLPERLRIVEDWKLIYSLEQDGASLNTLYQKAAMVHGQRVGFVLVVRDEAGGTFGGYLSEYPRPTPGYFGNGECFLWRVSTLAGLPPPPSADTTNINISRSTTISNPTPSTVANTESSQTSAPPDLLTDAPSGAPTEAASQYAGMLVSPAEGPKRAVSSAVSESLRFKAFPYSGVNEYYINCETGFLSMGAGDGHYGLWLDDSLYRGRSGRSQTFGNEPLSDEGEKFGILGVELWVLGAI
ncbi:TLD-domain-containing protein [Sodiomyces alkalinus F11]|uniref:Oxidation resistance protein 1 n=1 Tax=Sodiomyces alkalinus (strain CBS 110278 / VKM F-3762 / F11) TaxID=1314773 RepID=A0A3N2Q7H2_SODAK|nr:TLD-domain-containing protein [Sodiomyces alkalinus F11]ROT42729.1 TLD-domain-containing protein [Sodiomyces alkalinus F11]